ncbi:hypothetical protein BGZ73_000702 [Actinomortierella ambigua]|nr:hypothetical protein BGZ73_000702 [Actinomortierella ambigua]
MTRTQSHACLRVRTGPHSSTRKHVYRRQTLASISPYGDSDSSPRDNTTDLEGWAPRSKHHHTKQQLHPHFIRVDHHHDYDANDIDSHSPWDTPISLSAGGDSLGSFDPSADTVSCSAATSVTAAALAKAQSLGYIPLPPAVCRVNLAGSPLSPYTREDTYETQGRFIGNTAAPWHRSGNSWNNGYRTMSSGAPGGGGGTGPGGETMAPGGGDDPDGAQPGSYTFRRRNAVVEGTEEAPNPSDFPDPNSPK